MILERLLDFHDTQDQIIPAALKAQRVRWFLDLDEDGRYLGLSETGANKKEWKELVAPYVKRTSATLPFLLVDKPDYVLGHVAEAEKLSAAKQEQEQAKANDRHAEYVALARACAEVVAHPALDAFVGFLDAHLEAAHEEAAQLPMKSGDLIAPRVGYQILTDLPAVRRFWQAQQDEAAAEKSRPPSASSQVTPARSPGRIQWSCWSGRTASGWCRRTRMRFCLTVSSSPRSRR